MLFFLNKYYCWHTWGAPPCSPSSAVRFFIKMCFLLPKNDQAEIREVCCCNLGLLPKMYSSLLFRHMRASRDEIFFHSFSFCLGMLLASPGGVLGASSEPPGATGCVLGPSWGRLRASGECLGVQVGALSLKTAPISRQDCLLSASRLPKIVTRPRQDAPRPLQEGDISADLEARCSFH